MEAAPSAESGERLEVGVASGLGESGEAGNSFSGEPGRRVPSGARLVGQPTAQLFGPARAQPVLKLIGSRLVRRDPRVVPGPKCWHVG